MHQPTVLVPRDARHEPLQRGLLRQIQGLVRANTHLAADGSDVGRCVLLVGVAVLIPPHRRRPARDDLPDRVQPVPVLVRQQVLTHGAVAVLRGVEDGEPPIGANLALPADTGNDVARVVVAEPAHIRQVAR